jgi:adenylate kinase family enzyme
LSGQGLFEVILLLGPTAAGKTPLGDMISSEGIVGERCVHFDFGNELRRIASASESNKAFSGDEVRYIRGVLEEGLLLENEKFYLAKKIFRDFTKKQGAGQNDVIVLNGLPRHIGQARDMTDMVNVRTVAELKCSDDNVFCRISENTGGDRSKRLDDDSDLVMKKIETYNERTRPLVDFYRERGAALIELEVKPDTDTRTMYKVFVEKYQSLHLNAQ